MSFLFYVGAAAGCDLLIFGVTDDAKRSQPAAAPTGYASGHPLQAARIFIYR
jgi:hypothetical protein